MIQLSFLFSVRGPRDSRTCSSPTVANCQKLDSSDCLKIYPLSRDVRSRKGNIADLHGLDITLKGQREL